MEEITENIKEVQSISLEILKFIDKVCKENDIKYSLCGGTLLGAIRHKGFIPWDDDIDIFMLRKDYDKFLEIMDKDSKTNKKYKALHFSENCKDYFYRFTKVVDLDTVLTESTYITPKDMGVFVDIFPMDDVDTKNIKKVVKKNKKLGSLLAISANKKAGIKGNSFAKKCAKFVVSLYAKPFGWKHWAKKSEKYATSFNGKGFDHIFAFSGAYGIKDVFPKSMFDEFVELDFEGYKFPAIKQWDMYLKQLYGDYMTPPSPEKQITHHDFKAYKK